MTSISPVLKTTITKSDVSTSSKLRYYVKRELNVSRDDHTKSRLDLHNIFQTICQHELDFAELALDLSLSCFCRTGVVDSCVILECDSECETVRVCISNMTFTPVNAVTVAHHYKTVVSNTCVDNSKARIRKLLKAKFDCPQHRQTIVKTIFEEPLRLIQGKITPYVKQFNEAILTERVQSLAAAFSSFDCALVHGNYTAENIMLKKKGPSCGSSNAVAFGADLSHIGNGFYDVGVFLADLLIWHYLHESNPEENDKRRQYCATLRRCIFDFLTAVFSDLDLICDSPEDPVQHLQMLCGFAGVSMLFRLTESDWNEALPIPCSDVRNDILGCAYRLISGCEKITSINSVLMIGLMLA